MKNNNLAWLDQAKKEAMLLAEKTVSDMRLPTKIFLAKSLLTMGGVINKTYLEKYNELAGKYDVIKLSNLTASANKHYLLASHSSSNLMKLVFTYQGHEKLDETQQQLSNAETIANDEGWARLFSGYLTEINTNKSLRADGFNCDEDSNDALGFMGLYWLNIADKTLESGYKYDLIAEAFNAINISDQDKIFHLGSFNTKSEIEYQHSQSAIKAIANKPIPTALKEIDEEFKKVSHKFKIYGYGVEFTKLMHLKYPCITDSKTISRRIAKLKAQLEKSITL